MIAAAAAGAAIGLLFAPEKGSDLRKRIKNTASDWMDDLNEVLATGKEKVKEAYANAKEDAEDLENSVRDTMSRSKQS